MKFHNVHGSAISFSEGKITALRSDNDFCNGIVFSDHAIRAGHKFCVELACTQAWSGGLRIGFTLNDPGRLTSADLPKYSVPHLAKRDYYWIRPISESLTGDGYHLMFYIGMDGSVQFFVNNEHKGVLLVGLPADRAFWVMFDIYGNTKGIKLIKPDDTPKEIMAQGPEAIKAYDTACTSGMRPVYSTRLMLVGQDGAGKTSLKKALLGQEPSKSEEGTSGIDLSTSCRFCVGGQGPWTPLTGSQLTSEEDGQTSVQYDTDALEEEYNQALATNIVQELMLQKRRKTSFSQKPKPPSRESIKTTNSTPSSAASSGARKLSGKPASASNVAKFSEIPQELFKEVPEKVVELVQKMLDAPPPNLKSQDSTVSMATRLPEGTPMVLNVWDFGGKEMYYTTHQVFLSSRAVYVFVFNLNVDLDEPVSNMGEPLSTLEYLDFWLRSVFVHASVSNNKVGDRTTFSPPVFIVGTHKDCLNAEPDQIENVISEKFSQIEDFVVGKPYVQHLVTPFYAVDNSLQDSKLPELQRRIEEVSSQEPYIGERMPIRWIRFHQDISNLVKQGSHFATYDQVTEIAGNLGIIDYQEIMTMLEFYHNLGVIIYYGSGKSAMDNLLRNTVILSPQWLVNMFKHVVSVDWRPPDKWNLIRDKWTRLQEFGILEEALLDTLWHDAREQKPLLLGLLEKFDLACLRLPSVAESQAMDQVNTKSYYVPARLSAYCGANLPYSAGENDVTFYIDFNGFLPSGLFQRIITRTTRWSQDVGGQNPHFLYRQVARFFLDMEHDFVIEMAARKYNRVKVVVMRVSESDTDTDNKEIEGSSPPRPAACAKVRNFLESCLSELRELWMKRLSYSVVMACFCERVCEQHKQEGCRQETCLHFLNLDECLANKIVMCGHRRIKTASIRKSFPEPFCVGFNGPVFPSVSLVDTCGNIEKNCPSLPTWVKSAAKMLNTGETGKDWNALARELGYQQNQINTFNDDLNPGLALLADWIISSGNTGLSVDMLSIYLEKLDREDVIEIIQKAQEQNQEPAQVFISYQWDSQDEVKALRDRLERSGLTCWMDIGQLGGGDHLYTKIDEALRSCKAVISCVSPKYIVSHHCSRELSLADLLRKPIIPIMMEQTIWPPPGGMALIFSQLVYINMKGVGGHGGTGIHADKKDKYREIIQRISQHATPDLTHSSETESDIQSKKSQFIDGEYVSDYSEHADRYSLGSSGNSMVHIDYQLVPLRAYPTQPTAEQQTAQETQREPAMRPVEQVHVTQCRVCTIL
ncbi:uncharacterized protein LOC128214780 isoform X2 [Mya arenaria]|uniref:uncharacterized protein LOC128214780 isoform X2 n=1 Tax=Mya arenaria TaxID=6604 RepID=UPI0022E78D0D|nr:uncharacterized protein LOC128214780 isoform X2 [Mya arenaria]